MTECTIIMPVDECLNTPALVQKLYDIDTVINKYGTNRYWTRRRQKIINIMQERSVVCIS